MQDTLTVDVNPDGMHTLTVPDRFEADGAFDIVLKNHGEPTHVYLNFDDELSEKATLNATNYYIEQDETLPITISISSNSTVSGDLTVATAYGGEKRIIPITIEPSEQSTTRSSPSSTSHKTYQSSSTSSSAAIASPSPRSRSGGTTSSLAPSSATSATAINEQTIRRLLPAIVFSAVAIILALSSLLVTGVSRVVLGALAILACVFVAVYFAPT